MSHFSRRVMSLFRSLTTPRPRAQSDLKSQLEQTYSALSTFGALSLAGGILFVILNHRELAPLTLAAWLLPHGLFSGIAYLAKRRWRSPADAMKDAQIRAWYRALVIFAGAFGSLWGVGIGVFYPAFSDSGRQLSLLLICAMTTASVFSFSYVRSAFHTYIMMLLVPLSFQLLRSTDSFQLGLLILGYAAFVIALGRTARAAFTRKLHLIEENRQLLSEVEEVNRRLTSGNDALIDSQLEIAELAKARGEFLAVMTHELRTPVSGIIGVSQLIQGSQSLGEVKELMETISSSANSLLGLVNNILDLSKIDKDEIDLEWKPLSLGACIHDSLSIIRAKAMERGIELRAEIADDFPLIMGDALRLQQVLVNLTNNGLKFTPKGSISVTAVLQRTPSEERVVEVSVKDTGIGLDANQAGKLFAPYVQADSSVARRHGGTGLGLAICKGIVERMGGKIWVESEVGKGSAFKFIFRTSEAPAGSTAVNLVAKNTVEPLTVSGKIAVLVAEDDPVNRMVASRLLQEVGIDATLAEDGGQAKDELQRTAFDLVITDMMMPKLDGLSLIRWHREVKPPGEGPFFVVVTASAMVEERDRALASGADLYTAKPLTREKVQMILGAYLKREPQPHAGKIVDIKRGTTRPADTGTTVTIRVDTKVINAIRELSGTENPDFFMRLLGEYSRLMEKNLPLIERAIRTNSASDLKSAAHLLKGSSINIGAVRLVELLKALETKGKEASFAGTEELLACVRTEYEAFLDEVKSPTPQAA